MSRLQLWVILAFVGVYFSPVLSLEGKKNHTPIPHVQSAAEERNFGKAQSSTKTTSRNFNPAQQLPEQSQPKPLKRKFFVPSAWNTKQIKDETENMIADRANEASNDTTSNKSNPTGTRGVRRLSESRKERSSSNGQEYKLRRGLKGETRKHTKGEGVGKLKDGAGKAKKGIKGRKTKNPIECNARKGKVCKKGDVTDDSPGERRGPLITKEGGEEPIVRPDFSLENIYDGEATFELNPENLDYYSATSGEKRFFNMPTADQEEQVSEAAISSRSVVSTKEANKATKEAKKATPVPQDRNYVSEFVPRPIPNRYGRSSSTVTNDNPAHATTNTNNQAPNQEESWVNKYYKATGNSFYGGNNVKAETDASSSSSSTIPNTPVPTETEEQPNQDVNADADSEPQASASDYYAAWFDEMEDGAGENAAPAQSVKSSILGAHSTTNPNTAKNTNTNPDTFFQDEEDEEEEEYVEEEGEDSYYYGDVGENVAGNYLDQLANEPVDKASTIKNETVPVDEDKDDEATAQAPYLSFFGGSSSSSSPSAQEDQGQTENEDKIAGALKSDAVEGNGTVKTEEDGDGLTYFDQKVTADPIYVETRGNTDLSLHKREVFDTLEPLLTRYLEDTFGDDLLEDYQMTINFIKSGDSVTQLRKNANAKNYVTQLVVLVVLHLRSTDQDAVAAVTSEAVTNSIDTFFDPNHPNLKTFLRVLNAKGLYTKELYAQNKPHPPRDQAMDHGISNLTPSDTKDSSPESYTKDKASNEKSWFSSLFDNDKTETAILASLGSALTIFLFVIGCLWFKRDLRDRDSRSRAVLDTVSDIGSDIGSRAQVSLQNARDQINYSRRFGRLRNLESRARVSFQNVKIRINRAKRASSLNLGGRSSAASVRSHSDSSSTLSYIQPAAIQLRKNRPMPVPLEESPLEGRQTDDHIVEDPKKPESIYDIDIDDEKDFRGKRQDIPRKELFSMHDYESDSSGSSDGDSDGDSDDSSSDGEQTRTSQLSRLSLDRISIARSNKAMEEKISMQETVHETFHDEDEDDGDEESQGDEESTAGSFLGSILGSSFIGSRIAGPRVTSEASKGTSRRGYYADYMSKKYRGAGSRLTYTDDGGYSYDDGSTAQRSTSIHTNHATADETEYQPSSYLSPVTSAPRIRQTSNTHDDVMTQKSFMPLSPLSAALAEALQDSPKPLTHTASRPPAQEVKRRTAVDPPEDRSFSTGQYPRYGARMSPPTSMQDIMPGEYLNRSRWHQEDDEDDTTVDLPDHMSSTAGSRYSYSTALASNSRPYIATDESSVGSDMNMTTETRLVLHESEKNKKYSTPYRY